MDKITNAASAEGDRLGYNPYRDSKGRFDDGLTLADITGRPFSAKGTNDKKVKKAKKLVQEELDRLAKQLPKFLEDGGPQSIADLARLSGSDRAKVYKKLSDMEAKGKVTSRKQGITRMYTLTPKTKGTETLENLKDDETVAAVGQKSYIERDLAASARLDLKAAQAREQKDAIEWATEQGLDMPKASASDDEISAWTEQTVQAFRDSKKKAQQEAVAGQQANLDKEKPDPKAQEADDQKASADKSKTIEVGDKVRVKGKQSSDNPYGGEWATVAEVDGDFITVNPAGDTKMGLEFMRKDLKLDTKAPAQDTNNALAEAQARFKEELATKPFYHGTNADNAKTIREGGFKGSTGDVLNPEDETEARYGQGVYLTDSQKDAEHYANLTDGGEVLELSVSGEKVWDDAKQAEMGLPTIIDRLKEKNPNSQWQNYEPGQPLTPQFSIAQGGAVGYENEIKELQKEGYDVITFYPVTSDATYKEDKAFTYTLVSDPKQISVKDNNSSKAVPKDAIVADTDTEFYHGTTPQNAQSLLEGGFDVDKNTKGYAESPYAFFMSTSSDSDSDHSAGSYGDAVVTVKPKEPLNLLDGSSQTWNDTMGQSMGAEDSAEWAKKLSDMGYDGIQEANGEVMVWNTDKLEISGDAPEINTEKLTPNGFKSFVESTYKDQADWTDDEKDAITAYTGEDYMEINGMLRNDYKFEYTLSEDERKEMIQNLRSAVKIGLTKDTVLFRGLALKEELGVGDEITDLGFGSTSFNSDRASRFARTHGDYDGKKPYVMKINAPQGTKGIIPSLNENNSLRDNEQEFILPDGMTYRVTGTEEKIANPAAPNTSKYIELSVDIVPKDNSALSFNSIEDFEANKDVLLKKDADFYRADNLERLAAQIGFNEKPTTAESIPEGATPLYRAWTNSDYYNSYLNDNQPRLSIGIHGSGLYFSTSEEGALASVNEGGDNGIVTPAYIDPTAKGVDAEVIKTEMFEAYNKWNDTFDKAIADTKSIKDKADRATEVARLQQLKKASQNLHSDAGLYAATKGYDYIYTSNNGSTEGQNEYVILNRSKVVFVPKEEITEPSDTPSASQEYQNYSSRNSANLEKELGAQVDDSDDYSEAEKAAARYYKVIGYQPINDILRTGSTSDPDEKRARDAIKALDGAKRNELTENTLLWRGGQFDNELSVGDTIQDKGFVSTSFDETVARDFATEQDNGEYSYVFKINAPQGTKGLFIGDDEAEWLLDRNSEFSVSSIGEIDDDGVITVELDIVPKDKPATNSVEQIFADADARDKELKAEIDTLKKEFTDLTAKGYSNLSEEEKSRRWELDKLIDEKRKESMVAYDNMFNSIKALAPVTNTATPDAALTNEGPTGFESLDDNTLESLGTQLWTTWGQDTDHYEYQGAPGSPRRKMALQLMRELRVRGLTGEYSPGIDDNRLPLYIEAHNEEVAIADAYVNLPEAEKAMTPYNRFRLSKKTDNAIARLENSIADDYLYDSGTFFTIPKDEDDKYRFFSWKDREEWLKNNPNQTNAMDDRLFQNATADDSGFWWEIRMRAYHKLEDGMDKDEIVDTVKEAFNAEVNNIYHSMSEQDEYYNSLNTGIGPLKLYRYGAIGGRRQANGAFFSPNKIYTETYSDRAMGDGGYTDIDKTAFKEYTIQAEDLKVYRTTNIEDLYEELFDAPLYARKNGYADDQRVKELWRKEKQIHKRLQDEGYDAIHYDYPSLDNGYSKRGRALGLDRNAAETVILSKDILADMKKSGKTVKEYDD